MIHRHILLLLLLYSKDYEQFGMHVCLCRNRAVMYTQVWSSISTPQQFYSPISIDYHFIQVKAVIIVMLISSNVVHKCKQVPKGLAITQCCFISLSVFSDGTAETSVSPCLAPSVFLHCLLHCLVIVMTVFVNFIFTVNPHSRTIPIVLVVLPFCVISEKKELIEKSNNASCWCVIYFILQAIVCTCLSI